MGGLTLETGATKAMAYPSKENTEIGKKSKWRTVRIISYFWGTSEFYVNGKLIARTNKGKDKQEGLMKFIARNKPMQLKNVKIWEICGGKGIAKANKEEHDKGKEKQS